MLKRQRPATPPPSSLDDYPSLTDGLIRPPHTLDPFQHRPKRQRTRPPPLDGALRGWLANSPHGESDGEEDWSEDAGDATTSALPPSTTAGQYKDTNSLLHELHVLNQHRLSFVHPPRDRSLDLVGHNHTRGPLVQDESALLYHTASPQPTHGGLGSQRYRVGSAEEKRLVDEVECVRQYYEDTNRLLGSLFLSRRREVESNPC